ncbi:MAG TPA: response regulator transcription factor [Puia sp.]|nr:response regulator transcription factor [Puia sp.]
MTKILLADDHSAIRQRLRQILLEGFPSVQIAEVSDGDLLVREALEGGWDLIVADISMPGQSGIEATRRIRARFPRLPVLLLSIYYDEDYARHVVSAGASAYLCKENAQDELVETISRLIV